MKSLLLGSLLAAVALFFWGFIYFAASGIPYQFLGPVTEAGPVLSATFPESGTYVVPDPRHEDVVDLHAQGPFAVVHLRKAGSTMMDPINMFAGFAHGWAYAFLLALLLRQICQKSGYLCRVGFVTLVGFTGAFMARIGDTVWWHKSLGWQLSDVLYATIGSALVGAVLAKFIKSPTDA